MPILLIIISCLTREAEGVLIKKYNGKHEKGGFIFTSIVSLFSMIFFLCMDLITDPNGIQITLPLAVYGILSGIAFATASLLTFIALGCGAYVLSKLILSYGILITIGYGLFTGETLSVFGWIGIALIAISLYLVKDDSKEETVKISKKWIICIALSVVCAGVFSVLQRHQQIEFSNLYDNEFMIITLGVSAVSLFFIGVLKDGKDLGYIIKNGSPYAIGAGISNGTTNLLTLYLYTLAPVSFVSPMNAGLAMIVSFLISKFIFKEKFSKLQYLGVLLGAIAIVLFNL